MCFFPFLLTASLSDLACPHYKMVPPFLNFPSLLIHMPYLADLTCEVGTSRIASTLPVWSTCTKTTNLLACKDPSWPSFR